MKRALATALLVVASCLAAVAPAGADPAPVYCGANDVVYPVVAQPTMSPSKVTIGRANKTVTVTVRASDDCAIHHIYATLGPKGVATNQVIYITSWTRIAGTGSNGTWQATRTLSDQERGGVWEIFKLEVVDTYYNNTIIWHAADTLQIRHETKTKLNNPRDKVYKTVTLVGRLYAYGDFGTWKVKIQSHRPGKKWKTVDTLTTNGWGDFSKKIKVTGTTYFRAVHEESNTTIGSKSATYKVKKR